MPSNSEIILYQRYVLHAKKYDLLRAINPKSFSRSLKAIKKIRVLLRKEFHVNTKLIHLLEKEEFSEEVQKTFAIPFCAKLRELNKILRQEQAVLCQTDILTFGIASMQKLFTGKEQIFSRRIKRFYQLVEQELVLHQQLFALSHTFPRSYQVPKEKVKSSWKLVRQLQQELRSLAQSMGNAPLVEKHGTRALVLISRIKKTEIYEFVQQDILSVKGRVEYIMAHPKENKLAYFLTTVYIVSPGTFEMTGIILFFRYLGKYTVSKTKKLRTKWKKA